MVTLVERLERGLGQIVQEMDELLDHSTIDFVDSRALKAAQRSRVMIPGLPDGLWGPSTDDQKQIQRRLLELWNPWREQVELLFSEDSGSRKREIATAANSVEAWIQRNGREGFSIPRTIGEAKQVFREKTDPLSQALRSLGATSGKVFAVPDTNVLIRTPDITTYGKVLGTNSYTVLLLPGVLGELDGHKVNHSNPNVREKARKMSDRIKGWRNQGSLASGVKVQGDIWVQVEGREPDLTKTLSWLQPNIVDDRIVAAILEVQRRRPTDRVVLLTGDTLMLSKADASNVPTADTPDPDP